MKDVLVLTGTNRATAGGRVLTFWAERLDALGYRLHVAFPGGGSLAEQLTRLDVPTLPAEPIWPRKLWPFPFLRQARRLSDYLHSHDIRLIHALGCNDFPLAREAARRRSIPVTTQVRWPREAPYCQWIFSRHPRPARLMCVTEAMVRYERPRVEGLIPPERVVAVRNGIDTEQFAPRGPQRRRHWRQTWGIPDEAFCIGVAGVIQERKQTAHLVDLIAALRQRGIDAWGVIAGSVDEPEYAREIRRRVGELGDAVRIVETGHVDDMADAYSAFDLTVSFARIETFGMSVAESIACGRPVVYYRIEVLDEVAGPGGIAVPMEDVEAAADTCQALAGDPDRLAEIRCAGIDHIRNQLSADASAAALAGVFDEILAESPQATT